MGNAALKHSLALLPFCLHLLLELLARSLAQAQLFKELIGGEIFEVLRDAPHWLHQLLLVILIVDLERAAVSGES